MGGTAGVGGSVRAVGNGERGSGTVLVVGLLGVAVALLLPLVLLASVAGARANAQGAADLAAIAGASAWHDQDGGAPCAVAGSVLVEHGARLVSCEVRGEDVVVTAAVPTRVGDANATARAGPA